MLIRCTANRVFDSKTLTMTHYHSHFDSTRARKCPRGHRGDTRPHAVQHHGASYRAAHGEFCSTVLLWQLTRMPSDSCCGRRGERCHDPESPVGRRRRTSSLPRLTERCYWEPSPPPRALALLLLLLLLLLLYESSKALLADLVVLFVWHLVDT